MMIPRNDGTHHLNWVQYYLFYRYINSYSEPEVKYFTERSEVKYTNRGFRKANTDPSQDDVYRHFLESSSKPSLGSPLNTL